MRKLKMIKFWCVAFALILWNASKGNDWHMVYIDFHFGDGKNGKPIRKQLIAKQAAESLDIYWQDLSKI